MAAGAAEVLDLVPPRDGVPAPDLVAPILDVVDVVVVFVIGLPGVAVLLATPAEKIRKCNSFNFNFYFYLFFFLYL